MTTPDFPELAALRQAVEKSPVPLAKWLPSGKAAHLTSEDRDWVAEHLLSALDRPDVGLREALKEAVRILSGGRKGYVGDHYIREVQVKQATVDRLRAVLRDNQSPEPARECLEPGCVRQRDHEGAHLSELFDVEPAALALPGEALRTAGYVLRRTREAFWSFLAAVELTPKYAADDGEFQEAVQAACDGSCHSGGCITGCDNTCHGITSHVPRRPLACPRRRPTMSSERATVTSDNAADLGSFSQYRKTATTRISDFTMPPGTTYQTPEGLKAEDEETRIAFDVQGGVYPIRESVFRASYSPFIPECRSCHHREHVGRVCNAGRGECQCEASDDHS